MGAKFGDKDLWQEVVRLRYGGADPDEGTKPQFSYPCIAKYLGVRHKRIKSIHEWARKERLVLVPKQPYLSEEHVKALTSGEYMQANQVLNLKERVAKFNQKHPDAHPISV